MIIDGSTHKIEHFKINNDKGEFKVKRILVERPAHITACDVADSRVTYEITQAIHPLIEQEIIKQVVQFREDEENAKKIKQ